jgi:hypothetical protein
MRGLSVLTGGGIPSVPTIGTAVAGNALATVTFTPSTYIGKGTVSYEVTSSPGGLAGTGSTSPIVLGVTNGTSYTFTVKAVTNYGVSSAASSASNSVTPVAPPAPPPGPPPPPPCSCTWNGQNCTGDGSNCGCTRVYPNTCDGTTTYQYFDCGCSQTCPGTGGYNGALIDGSCGYVAPAPCSGCGNCVSNGCGGTVCFDSCGNQCSNSGCAPPPSPPPPVCDNCGNIGTCCGSCSFIKDGWACL